jgi:group I intron endonuclease
MFYIYTIFNPQNYKFYVGQTENVKNRWSAHKCEANADRLHYPLYKALRKYGIENFQLSVVEIIETAEEANIAEQKWIQLLESRNPDMGYNLTAGGLVPRGWHHTEEHRRYISNLFKGKKIGPYASEETRQKLSNANMGHPVLPETRFKISKGHLGKSASLEAKKNMSIARMGVKLTDEHKNSISKGLIKFQETNVKTSNLSKLSFEEVKKIRTEWLVGNISQRKLAKKYGVHRITIMRIVNCQTRKRS